MKHSFWPGRPTESREEDIDSWNTVIQLLLHMCTKGGVWYTPKREGPKERLPRKPPGLLYVE